VKLSEKFARQESETARLARIARRRISDERAEAVRQFLGIPDDAPADIAPRAKASTTAGSHVCDVCGRRFLLPMHLGRHKRSAHKASGVTESPEAPGVGV
jgi:hypothetical protein